jgi:hypothetical protein
MRLDVAVLPDQQQLPAKIKVSSLIVAALLENSRI